MICGIHYFMTKLKTKIDVIRRSCFKLIMADGRLFWIWTSLIFSEHIPTWNRTFHFIVMVELSGMFCHISRILKVIMADWVGKISKNLKDKSTPPKGCVCAKLNKSEICSSNEMRSDRQTDRQTTGWTAGHSMLRQYPSLQLSPGGGG